MKNNITIFILRGHKFFIAVLLFLTVETIVAQITGNDTTIQAFNMLPQINSLQDTTVAVVFPSAGYKYEKILMHYSLSKPAAGWDPWDRIAYVRVFTQSDTFEIARVMTPYSKACSWTIDVTDYRPLLTDTALINSFILFWASNNKGYLVSINFEFIGGNPVKEAYKIENLWGNDAINRWEYGNYANPISNYFTAKTIQIDQAADSVKIKVSATGHGQGNTDNAAEFSNKTHSVVVDGNLISHQLWRNNCGQNPCSPQSGTWQYNRAGWCPGADVLPWEVDITSMVIPGNIALLEYQPEQYTNYCSSAYPNCISGQTCTDCNYNSNGHTMPWYLIQSQIIFYNNISLLSSFDKATKDNIRIYPNPSINGIFNIELSGLDTGSIHVTNILGEKIFQLSPAKQSLSPSVIDLSRYSSGVYFLKFQSDKNISVKKIIKQ